MVATAGEHLDLTDVQIVLSLDHRILYHVESTFDVSFLKSNGWSIMFSDPNLLTLSSVAMPVFVVPFEHQNIVKLTHYKTHNTNMPAIIFSFLGFM